MNGQQKGHKSEQQLDSIPEDWYTKVIDTTDLSLQEQVETVKTLVSQLTGAVNA